MQKCGLICFGLAVLLVVVAMVTLELDGANVLTMIMLGAAGLLLLIAFILVGLGSRAEKPAKRTERQ